MRKKDSLIGVAAIAIAIAQGSDRVRAQEVTFDDQVRAIFREHCLNCHNQNDQRGGLALDSYQAVMAGGSSGAVVEDGDPSVSRLYLLVAHEDTPVMPPEQDRLPDAKLALIRSWIEGGALENSGSQRKAKKKVAPLMASTAPIDQPPATPVMPAGLIAQPLVESSRAAATTALACSPWAPLAAVAGQRQVLLYDTQTAQLLGVLPFPEGVAQSLQFSRDGAYLMVAGGAHAVRGQAVVFDVSNGQRVASVGDELDIVLAADVNNDLTRIALGGPQKLVRVFDVATNTCVFELKKHTDWVMAARYSPDGVLLASGDRSGGLHVWEADTGRLYLDLPGHQGAIRSVAFQPDGNVLASASEDGTVRFWEMTEGKQIRSLQAHPGGVTSINYLRDGRFVTAGNDGIVKLWDAGGTELLALPKRSEAVLEAVAVHDGSALVAGDWNGDIQLHDIARAAEPGRPLPANPPRLETRLAQLTEQAAAAQAAADAAAQQRDALAAALAAAQQAAAAAEQTAAQSAASAAAIRSEAESVQQQLQRLAERDQQLTAALVQRQDAANQARQALEAQSAAVAQFTNSLAEQDKQLAELQQQLADLQARLQAVQNQRDQQATMHQEAQQRLDALTESAAQAEAAASAAQQELDLFRQAYPQLTPASPPAIAGT